MSAKKRPRTPAKPRKPRQGSVPTFRPATEEALQKHGPTLSNHAAIVISKHYGYRLHQQLVSLCEVLEAHKLLGAIQGEPADPASAKHKAYTLGSHLAEKEAAGEEMGALESHQLINWKALNDTQAEALNNLAKITTAAAQAIDAEFFAHLAEVMRRVRDKAIIPNTHKLKASVWYQYEVAYISARYRVNNVIPPNAEHTLAMVEFEQWGEEVRKRGGDYTFNTGPSLLSRLPMLPTWGDIERALVLPRLPTVEDVSTMLSHPAIMGITLAKFYRDKFCGKAADMESKKAQIRKTCAALGLELAKGSDKS